MTEIERRLSALEQLFGENRAPSFAEFSALWGDMDALSKSVYVCMAESGEHTTRLERTIAAHLDRMGLLDHGAKTLRELAAEMDAERD